MERRFEINLHMNGQEIYAAMFLEPVESFKEMKAS